MQGLLIMYYLLHADPAYLFAPQKAAIPLIVDLPPFFFFKNLFRKHFLFRKNGVAKKQLHQHAAAE